MDTGAWWVTVHGVAKSQSDVTHVWELLKLAEEAGSLKAAMMGIFTPRKSVNVANQSFFFDRDLVNKHLPGHCWVRRQSFSSLLQDWRAVTQG